MEKKHQTIISSIKVSIEDEQFPQKVFTAISRLNKDIKNEELIPWHKICQEEYDDLSRRLDLTDIQASVSVRNVLKTRRIALLLFTDKGELNTHLLSSLIHCFEHSLYSLGPDRQHDSLRQEHILHVLKIVQDSKEMQRFLKNVSKPHFNRFADQVIRETLNLPDNSMVTDADAKRAVLSAWMCYLRQNVGSCFATAPAILIHDDQPQQMLTDMIELLGTGRLKRTFGGIEYSVPISATWGAGDLKKPFVLLGGQSLEEANISVSPGLLSAFEAVNLIEAELPLKKRIQQNKALILDVIHSWKTYSSYLVTSAEEIIRRVLMKSLKLTDADLKDYENRPRNMLQSNLMMQTAALGGGKGQACANFYLRLEIAQNAFKSLADNALLKTWEFTLASFAEMKAEFTRWNLYASLGLDPQEPGGIGQALYTVLQQKIDESNRKIQEFQAEYEMAYQHIKYLEGRIRSASEKEAQWIKAEYEAKRNEFNTLEEMRNRYHRRGGRFSNLFNVLKPIYDELFPRYFQEVYDADMHEVGNNAYDDSPAGFRLLYKHGRSNTSQWTRIKNPSEFIDALGFFFSNTESEVCAAPSLAGIEDDVSEIITAMVAKIRSVEFLESAFYRMAKAHQTPLIKDPLDHLDKIEKKPWAYTSGGTMDTLVSSYYRTESLPTIVSRWVEHPTELLVFLIDTVKQIPPKLLENFNQPQKGLLIHSPTHAFLLKPQQKLFHEVTQNELFTYTYVRDHFILPIERFIRKIELEESMQELLIEKISKRVAIDVRFYFKQVFNYIAGKKDPIEFRTMLYNTITQEKGLRHGKHVLNMDEVDHLLYVSLPFFPAGQLRARCRDILMKLPGLSAEQIEEIFVLWDELPASPFSATWLDAKHLQDVARTMISLLFSQTSSPIDYHRHITAAAQELGYAMPAPVIFADTNWVKEWFAFVVSPGTGKLELWRVDCNGGNGYPMSVWSHWLDGSRHSPTWGVYVKPYEYQP